MFLTEPGKGQREQLLERGLVAHPIPALHRRGLGHHRWLPRLPLLMPQTADFQHFPSDLLLLPRLRGSPLCEHPFPCFLSPPLALPSFRPGYTAGACTALHTGGRGTAGGQEWCGESEVPGCARNCKHRCRAVQATHGDSEERT